MLAPRTARARSLAFSVSSCRTPLLMRQNARLLPSTMRANPIRFRTSFTYRIAFVGVLRAAVTVLPRPPLISAIAQGGGASTASNLAAAFAGGTVGVMGSLIAWELRHLRDRESKYCPYCLGTGQLRCGGCFGQGFRLRSGGSAVMTSANGESVVDSDLKGAVTNGDAMSYDCDVCDARKFVVCCHCGGDGRLIPESIQHAATGDLERE
mmetsp:Transcript_8383/g.18006  ORF Transcript_8383/g.18006 Transcript_8383/m.18006 type:complete len:209 (+) Transcript_8383:47-673(+)